MRSTLEIDDPILRMGGVVPELLAEALPHRRTLRARPAFRWVSRRMNALLDLADEEAVDAVQYDGHQ